MDGTLPTNEARKKRRSSILKSQRVSRTPFSELEFNVATPPPPDITKGRRVSFSRRTGVAEFATNEATTTWKNFYEEQNKSLESSDHDAGRHQPSVGHIGNRIFDQQFEEIEAEIDYAGTLGVPTSLSHNSTGNVTEQLALLESIDDRDLVPPQSNHELSSFTEQSKLFRDDLTNPKINSITERINIDFSSFNPLGGADDELDEIERDLKFDPPVVVGPTFESREVSQYIEVDLNITQAVRNNDSDMSITDTIRSPKKEVSQIAVKTSNNSSNKNWLEDKENIIVNPYMPPAEDNFTSNEVEKVLVFDGKKVKYADINADLDELIDDRYDKKEPKRNIVAAAKDTSKTVIFDDITADMSMTRPLQCEEKQRLNDFVDEIKKTNKTVIFDENAADMSITRPIQFDKERLLKGDLIEEIREINKTVIFDQNAADMSITRPVQFEAKQITHHFTEELRRASKTVIFDDKTADMSITRPLQSEDKQKIRDFANEIKQTNKTVIFDNNTADMSITRSLQFHEKQLIKRDFVDELREAKTVCVDKNVADKSTTGPQQFEEKPKSFVDELRQSNKTVIFEDNTADMSITRPLQFETKQIKRDFTDDPAQNKTILYDDNIADMSVTRPIPHLTAEVRTMLFDNADVEMTECPPSVAKSNETVRFRVNETNANMSVTQVIVNDLWRSAAQINRTNKVSHDCKLDDMSFTKIAPTIFVASTATSDKIHGKVDEQSEIECRSMDCDSDKQDRQSDMSFTQYISSSAGLSRLPTRSSITDEKLSDMSMTQAVPVSAIRAMMTDAATTDTDTSLPIMENPFKIAVGSDDETATLVSESVSTDPEKMDKESMITGTVTPSTESVSAYPQTTTSESMTVEAEIPTIESMIMNSAGKTKKVYIPDVLFSEEKAKLLPKEAESSSVIKNLLLEMNDCIQKTSIVIKAKVEPSFPSLNDFHEKNQDKSRQLESNSSDGDMSITGVLQPYLSDEPEPNFENSDSDKENIADTTDTEDKEAIEDKAKFENEEVTKKKLEESTINKDNNPIDTETDCNSIGIETSKDNLNFDNVAPSVFQGNNKSIVVCQATNFQKTNQAADLKKLGLENIASTLQEVLSNVSKEETPTVNVLIMNVINQDQNKVSAQEESDNSVVKEELPSNKGDEFHTSSDKFTDTKIELSNPHFTIHSNKAPKVLSKKTPERYDSHCERKIKTISYDALPTSSTLIDSCDEEKTAPTGEKDEPKSTSEEPRLSRSIHCCETRSAIAGDDAPLNKDEKQKKAILNRLLDMSGTCLGAGYDDKDVMASSSYSLYFSAVRDVSNCDKQTENTHMVVSNSGSSNMVIPASVTPNSFDKSLKNSAESMFSEQLQRKLQQLQTSVQTSIYNIDEDAEEASSKSFVDKPNDSADMSIQESDRKSAQSETSGDLKINANDTAELLQIISSIADKSRTVDQSTSPKKLKFVNEGEQIDAETEHIEQEKRRDSEAESSTSRAGKPNNSELSDPDQETRKTKCACTDPLSPERCSSQLSNLASYSPLRYCSRCGSPPRLKRTERNASPQIVSILKKSAYEEGQENTNDKNAVIPSFTVSDCIKDLMDDLVKPMADEQPYNNRLINKNPSKCSVQLQANLNTTSQIDLLEESYSPVICNSQFEEAAELELRDTAVATEGNDKVCDDVSLCRSVGPEFVMFDDRNPLNNVWLAPTDLVKAHKYEPIEGSSPEDCVSPEVLSITPNDSFTVAPAQIVTKSFVDRPEPPTRDSENDLITIDLTNNKCPFIRLSYPLRSGYSISKDYIPELKSEEFQDYEREKDLEVGVVMVSYDFEQNKDKGKCEDVEENEVKISNEAKKSPIPVSASPVQLKLTSLTVNTNRGVIPHLESHSGDKETIPDETIHKTKKRRLSEPADISSSDVDPNETKAPRRTHNCCKVDPKLTPRCDKRKSMNFSLSDNISPSGKSPLRKHRKGWSPDKNYSRTDENKWLKSPSNDNNPYLANLPTRDQEVADVSPNRSNQFRSPVKRRSFPGYNPKTPLISPNRGTQVNMFVFKQPDQDSTRSLDSSSHCMSERNTGNSSDQDKISVNTDYTMKTAMDNFPVLHTESIEDVASRDFLPCKGESDDLDSKTSTCDEKGSIVSSVSVCTDRRRVPCGETSSCQTDTEPEICQDDIIEKINKLKFLGNRVWEWDYSGKDPWSFFLLRRRIRMSVTFGDAFAFADKPIRSILIEPTQVESLNHLPSLCVRYAIDAMGPATSEVSTAADLPRILLRCAGVACLAIQWLKSMWNARTQLGCKIEGNVISFKVANPQHRQIWHVRITVASTYHAAGIYPRAVSTAVTALVPSQRRVDEEVERALDTILCNWGHVPNTIWRVYRLLNNKLCTEGMLSKLSTV